jgi:hypothetical protein
MAAGYGRRLEVRRLRPGHGALDGGASVREAGRVSARAQLRAIAGALDAAGIDVIAADYAAAVHGVLEVLARLRDVTAEPDLTPAEAAEAWTAFRSRRCSHCGGAHGRACPRVRRMRFHPDSRLASVEFWPDGSWDPAGVMWPEDLPPEPGDASAQA